MIWDPLRKGNQAVESKSKIIPGNIMSIDWEDYSMTNLIIGGSGDRLNKPSMLLANLNQLNNDDLNKSNTIAFKRDKVKKIYWRGDSLLALHFGGNHDFSFFNIKNGNLNIRYTHKSEDHAFCDMSISNDGIIATLGKFFRPVDQDDDSRFLVQIQNNVFVEHLSLDTWSFFEGNCWSNDARPLSSF